MGTARLLPALRCLRNLGKGVMPAPATTPEITQNSEEEKMSGSLDPCDKGGLNATTDLGGCESSFMRETWDILGLCFR
eukprot:12883648-Prorocentrum_lima.AAC.1